jgi:hypothetical protein
LTGSGQVHSDENRHAGAQESPIRAAGLQLSVSNRFPSRKAGNAVVIGTPARGVLRLQILVLRRTTLE